MALLMGILKDKYDLNNAVVKRDRTRFKLDQGTGCPLVPQLLVTCNGRM